MHGYHDRKVNHPLSGFSIHETRVTIQSQYEVKQTLFLLGMGPFSRCVKRI